MVGINVVVARDGASFDPDLLQLQDVPQLALYERPGFAEELYCQWLSLSETGQLVMSLIEDAKEGASINATASNSLLSIFPAGGAPPLSRRSTSSSTQSLKHSSETETPSVGDPLKSVNEPILEVIPQFYFQNGCPAHTKQKEQCISKIDRYFFFFCERNGIQIHEFKLITKSICKLPSFLSTALFRKIDVRGTGVVTRDAFVDYWVNSNIMMKDKATQIFTILNQPDCNYLAQADFKPVLQEVLLTHPGLEFLKDTDFQDRYVETVIYRIFYYMNRSGNGHLTLRELKRGDLIAAIQLLDEEENINKVLRYFSYEHFYVIYCNFAELDTDHDLLLDHENLIRYGNYGLTNRIVSRIFSQVPRKFRSSVEGKMCYEDFVYFILSEEDKSSEPSIEFWFKCIDMDDNGVLTREEIQFFYMEQSCRFECMVHQPISFEDIWGQIIDMIQPVNESYLTLRDFKGSKLAGRVFNILFNFNKLIAYESRDPFLIQQERGNPTLTEWDLFAQREYASCVIEELGLDSSDGDADDLDNRL